MDQDVQPQVEVEGIDIVVTLPGTRLKVTYQRSNDGPWLVEKSNHTANDPAAPMTSKDFVAEAFRLASGKARKLGWIV